LTSSPIMSCPNSPRLTQPQSTGLSGFGGNAGVLSQAATIPKQLASFKMHFSWFGLPCQRKPLTTLWKTTASDCRQASQQ